MRVLSARNLSAILAVAAMILLILFFQKTNECKRQAARLDTLYGQAKALERIAALSKQRADSVVSSAPAAALSPIHNLYIGRLRELGLREPVADLISDLSRHPELISYPGVHGGHMAFNDASRIRVLSDAWVYAPFEDGHNGGELILEYRVAPGGRISWHVLQSRMQ